MKDLHNSRTRSTQSHSLLLGVENLPFLAWPIRIRLNSGYHFYSSDITLISWLLTLLESKDNFEIFIDSVGMQLLNFSWLVVR